MQETILAISGKPGLYKLVSRGNNNLIVEALDETHRRMPAFGTDRITSLGDVAMFTETDDIPLMKVFDNVKKLEGGKKSSVDYKKASGDELQAYFAASAYTTATSRNSSSGTTSLLPTASPTSLTLRRRKKTRKK